MLWIHTVLIQGSRDQLAFDQSPELIAVFHALHRLLAPRHPPHALSSLAALIHPLTIIRRLRVRLTDQEKIKLRYRPVRAFGQVCVTKSILRFSRRIQRISFLHKKPSSLVKIQLFPLPNCQRTTTVSEKRWRIILGHASNLATPARKIFENRAAQSRIGRNRAGMDGSPCLAPHSASAGEFVLTSTG
jgi:hypothetical protein